jgi:hypothetical protein
MGSRLARTLRVRTMIRRRSPLTWIPVFDWVWGFDGRRLSVIHRYPNEDATTVVAEPW